jgi:hypothetical protein
MFKKLLQLLGGSDDGLPIDPLALIKQAEEGNVKAQYALGKQYYQGYGHPENDYGQAIYWFTKAADQDHIEALYYCGQMYDTGRGVEKDSSKAFTLFSKAAYQGHAGAQFDLGIMYKNGEGVKKNNEKAIEWFKKAADQGHEQAKKWQKHGVK